jgi:hypothetical protein
MDGPSLQERRREKQSALPLIGSCDLCLPVDLCGFLYKPDDGRVAASCRLYQPMVSATAMPGAIWPLSTFIRQFPTGLQGNRG